MYRQNGLFISREKGVSSTHGAMNRCYEAAAWVAAGPCALVLLELAEHSQGGNCLYSGNHALVRCMRICAQHKLVQAVAPLTCRT